MNDIGLFVLATIKSSILVFVFLVILRNIFCDIKTISSDITKKITRIIIEWMYLLGVILLSNSRTIKKIE